jgi:predicted dehydrogenase
MRVAVLGCGSIGRRHLRNLCALGLTPDTLWAYDPEPSARRAAAAAIGAREAADLEAVWCERPEVVIVAAPPDRHIDLALDAVERGCHVFVEKPLAASLEGVDALRGAAQRQGAIVMVACNMRFHPGPARVQELLRTGRIGTVLAARLHTGSYLPGWRPDTDYHRSYSASTAAGGGVLLDCIHELDLARWYFGPGEVLAAATGQADTLGIEVEGIAEIVIRHANGVLTSVHLNFVQRDYRRECMVIGTDGTIYWDFETGLVQVRDGMGSIETFPQPPGWNVNAMYLDELAHYLDSVRQRVQPHGTLDDGAAVLRWALAARALAHAGNGADGREPVRTL